MSVPAGMGPRELVARAYGGGVRAGEAGETSSACPYRGGGRREVLGRLVWVRGYVAGMARRPRRDV